MYLPITEFVPHFDPEVGEIDWSKVNYIRCYFHNQAKGGLEVEQTMKIDGLYVGMESDFTVEGTPTVAPTTTVAETKPTTPKTTANTTAASGEEGGDFNALPIIIGCAAAVVVIAVVVIVVVVKKRKK